LDRADLEHLLADVEGETTEVQHTLVSLQARLDALIKTGDGIRALLQVMPEPPSERRPSLTAVSAEAHLVATAEMMANASVTEADSALPQEPPAGSSAARKVLQSDPSRFWTVRQVWDEEIKLGWIKPDPSSKGAAVRIALVRLNASDPRVERVDGPVVAYRWRPEPSPNHNGSAVVDVDRELA
jgi:hypothetical protein